MSTLAIVSTVKILLPQFFFAKLQQIYIRIFLFSVIKRILRLFNYSFSIQSQKSHINFALCICRIKGKIFNSSRFLKQKKKETLKRDLRVEKKKWVSMYCPSSDLVSLSSVKHVIINKIVWLIVWNRWWNFSLGAFQNGHRNFSSRAIG